MPLDAPALAEHYHQRGKHVAAGTRERRLDGVNAGLPGALHNDSDPQYYIKYERPLHRLVIYLAANGLTMKEIAAKTEQSTVAISNILRQPWARAKMIEVMKETGEENIRDLLKPAAKDALLQIIKISKNEDGLVPAAVQLAASVNVVDRFLGKPTQPITTEEVAPEKLSDEELEARIAAKSN